VVSSNPHPLFALERIENVDHLEALLSEPTPQAIEAMARMSGDLMLLGVGGKMGPTLARMARQASDRAGVKRRIVGVARFSDPRAEAKLHAAGVETVRCNLQDAAALGQLPKTPNVLAMFGMKFGATGQESQTWAVNCLLPAKICETFPSARIVAFSTGNVYGLTSAAGSGSLESDLLNAVGEYAMSCVGRERIYEHCSRTHGIPLALLRLNYAAETRYGVMVDLAQRVWDRQPVDLNMGRFNTIWQADANAAALAAFDHVGVPPLVVNIAGPEMLSVRDVAQEFGKRFGRPVTFQGAEGEGALLSNGQLGFRLFGEPRVGAEQLMAWIADWIARGQETLGKPTHFEVRDGRF
jgi:nucleoside-diphosphate-sugar epimerase